MMKVVFLVVALVLFAMSPIASLQPNEEPRCAGCGLNGPGLNGDTVGQNGGSLALDQNARGYAVLALELRSGVTVNR